MDLVERLERALGLSHEDADLGARVVLSVMLEQLPGRDRARLLHALPGALAQRVTHDGPEQSDTLEQLYARVAQRAALELGHAVEQTQVVCGALVEQLDPDSVRYLRSRLPASFALLFEAPTRRERAPEPPHGERRYPTLAEGRSGSRHPLSESHPERAHQDSIARSPNPHAESKLSSARGATQEREAETLASGKPGPSRKLGEGKE